MTRSSHTLITRLAQLRLEVLELHGWADVHLAGIPNLRVVKCDTKWRAIDWIQRYGDDQIVRHVKPIRAALETLTGAQRVRTHHDITEGLRGMPAHWYRGALALVEWMTSSGYK